MRTSLCIQFASVHVSFCFLKYIHTINNAALATITCDSFSANSLVWSSFICFSSSSQADGRPGAAAHALSFALPLGICKERCVGDGFSVISEVFCHAF